MEISISLEALAGLTSTSQEDLKGMLFEEKDGETVLKEGVNPTAVASDLLKSKFKKISDDQFKAGERKKGQAWESGLKELGYSGDAKGLDALTEFLESYKPAPSKGDPAKITTELLDKDPVAKEWFQSRFNTETETLRNKLEEVQKLSEAREQEYRMKDHRKALFEASVQYLDGELKWDDGGDLREKRVSNLKGSIPYERFKKDESGNFILHDAEGTPERDDNLNPKTLQYFLQDWNPFGTKQYADKSSPSPTPAPGGGKSKIVVKDLDHRRQLLAEADKIADPAKRAERRTLIHESFHEQHTAK